jgi:hypothetical protein
VFPTLWWVAEDALRLESGEEQSSSLQRVGTFMLVRYKSRGRDGQRAMSERLDFDSMNETDVREIVVRPLIERLGYRHGTEATIHEHDFPGRYNRPFEWKPLIYPGDASHLIAECQQLSTDPDVQGVLLYMRLTGRKCIEFAVRSNMELPGTFTHTESGDVLIHKCPSDEDGAHLNTRACDCTMI